MRPVTIALVSCGDSLRNAVSGSAGLFGRRRTRFGYRKSVGSSVAQLTAWSGQLCDSGGNGNQCRHG